MTGIEYEEWCISYLKGLGFHHIRKTKASGDQGIDLIAERRGVSYGFQCKYHTASIGNDAVQQAYAGRTYYGLDRAAVITNSSFTKSAKELAEETEVLLYEHMEPSAENHASLLIRIPALTTVCLCFLRFAELMRMEEGNGFAAAAFALIGSLSALVFAQSAGWLAFAAAMCAVSLLILVFAGAYTDLFFTALVFLMMLVLIRMTVLFRSDSLKRAKQEKAELKEMIREQREQLAEEIVRLFCAQLEREVKIEAVRKNAQGSLIIDARANRIDGHDLALAAYTLNQQALAENENIRFSYRMKEGNCFELLCEKPDEK